MQHDHILKKLILCKPVGPLLAQGYNLNKLGRGLLCDDVKDVTTGTGPCFGSRGIIWNRCFQNLKSFMLLRAIIIIKT